MKLMIRKDDNKVRLQLRLKREHNSTSFGDRKVKAGITGLRKIPLKLNFPDRHCIWMFGAYSSARTQRSVIAMNF